MKKIKEKSDQYYLDKYHLSEAQLADYKKQIADIGDSDLIIEDLIDPEISLGLPLSAKVSYLEILRNKIITILFLIEQQKENPQSNPDNYLLSLLIDIKAANLLFGDELTEIYIKVYGIYNIYKESAHNVIRKQVLETRRLVDDLLRTLNNGVKPFTKSKKDGNK